MHGRHVQVLAQVGTLRQPFLMLCIASVCGFCLRALPTSVWTDTSIEKHVASAHIPAKHAEVTSSIHSIGNKAPAIRDCQAVSALSSMPLVALVFSGKAGAVKVV